MSLSDRTPPTVEEFLGYREQLSNWGRWGEDDELGTLNFITAERRREAAMQVRDGRSVSLSVPVATVAGHRNPTPAQHYVMHAPRGSRDFIGLIFHGFTNTHIDGLCHVFGSGGVMYNGRPASAVSSAGAAAGSIDHWREGIFTRGVLYDIPRLRGQDFVGADEPVHGWDLQDAAAAQGIEPRPGDAALVRSGKEPFLQAHPEISLLGQPATYQANGEVVKTPGVHASALEFLYETDAALLGWDFLDAAQQGYPSTIESDPKATPLHQIAIPYMGLALLDNMQLEDLAATCAELGRWEFLFVVSPLVVTGGTGSPVNPLALF